MDEQLAAPKPRNATIDGLKYVAAAAIVMHHVAAHAGGRLGTFLVAAPLFALFFFFAVSGYFHGTVGNRGWKWLRRRVGRLALPYAIWSVVLLLWTQRAVFSGASLVMPSSVDLVFFAGAHGILWTLPMLVYCAIAAELLVRGPLARRLLIGVCVVLTLVMYWAGSWEAIATHPLANFLLAPRWFLAYLAGMEIRATVSKTPSALAQLPALVGVVAVGMMRVNASLIDPRLYTTVETAVWVGIALVLLWGAHAGLTWFGAARLSWGRDYLIGVYITHVVWLELFAGLLPPWTLRNLYWIPLAWAATLLAATATVALLRSNRVTRVAVA